MEETLPGRGTERNRLRDVLEQLFLDAEGWEAQAEAIRRPVVPKVCSFKNANRVGVFE